MHFGRIFLISPPKILKATRTAPLTDDTDISAYCSVFRMIQPKKRTRIIAHSLLIALCIVGLGLDPVSSFPVPDGPAGSATTEGSVPKSNDMQPADTVASASSKTDLSPSHRAKSAKIESPHEDEDLEGVSSAVNARQLIEARADESTEGDSSEMHTVTGMQATTAGSDSNGEASGKEKVQQDENEESSGKVAASVEQNDSARDALSTARSDYKDKLSDDQASGEQDN